VFGADYDTPDGSCVRDFVHVDDLADAHVAATALLDALAAETFNVGVGRGYSVLEVVAAIARVAGRPVEPVLAERRPGDPAAVVADVTRIRERLGWTARHDLDDIVASAWDARFSPSVPAS
jgi:UDP-glucose 4-epimerase